MEKVGSKPFKVIIAGGRDCNYYPTLRHYCDKILANSTNIEVVSGCSQGADKLGEDYARERGYPIKEFPADWKRHGYSAGPIRNIQMAEYADALIVFWDGTSRGTGNMVKEARKRSMPIKIKRY